MKHTSRLLVSAALSIMAVVPPSFADDKLPAPASAAERDGHISWHEFLHELGSYPQVNSTMSSGGIITLTGHVDGTIDKRRIETLARKVRDASDIRSLLNVD